MTLPLSKTMAPADYADLADELVIVDRWFASASPQHPARRWEYALALRAYDTWRDADAHARGVRLVSGPIYDVGGAGSPFYRMIGSDRVWVVDPAEADGMDLAQCLLSAPRLAYAVFCLSVLEHIDAADFDRFLYHLGCLVAPGGLLFLTVDVTDSPEEEDHHHFHWMRKRIFRWTPELDPHFAGHQAPFVYLPDVTFLLAALTRQNFSLLGEIDPVWHGDQLYNAPPGAPRTGYSFASLALVKRR